MADERDISEAIVLMVGHSTIEVRRWASARLRAGAVPDLVLYSVLVSEGKDVTEAYLDGIYRKRLERTVQQFNKYMAAEAKTLGCAWRKGHFLRKASE